MPININRIDCNYKFMHGFQVRLCRESAIYFSKFFADHKHGGADRALTLACIALQQKYDEGYTLPAVAHLAGQTRHVGTHITPRRKGGTPSLYWQVSLSLTYDAKQNIRFYVSTRARLDLAKARYKYRIANGIQAYQKELSIEKGVSERFELQEYDLDHLASLYPISTDFITMDYLQNLFNIWEYKQ